MTAALVDPAKVVDLGIVSRESRVTPGFTAIWIIVISAIGYSVRIAIDPSAGNHLLTGTFLAANVAGWLLGAWLRSRDRGSTLGFLLVLLGDAIFPLNLFAPLLLFVPGLRGDTPLTASAVIVVGITYHLYNYWNRSNERFALPFYPYFFATISCAGLILLQYTAGLSLRSVAWLVLLFAIAFNEISHRWRPARGSLCDCLRVDPDRVDSAERAGIPEPEPVGARGDDRGHGGTHRLGHP